MTIVDNGATAGATGLSDADAALLARADWHESGGTLTGKALAERYGRSPRWGQKQRAAAEKEAGRGTRAASPKAPGGVPRPEPKPKPAAQPVKRRRDPWQVAAVGVVLTVGLAVSYSHIVHLALLAGGGWWAWVMPLPLDGMALVSIRHLARERRYLIAWLGVAVGAVGSLTANVLAIDPTLADMRYVRWGFAALPPIAVVLCGHLLDRGNRP